MDVLNEERTVALCKGFEDSPTITGLLEKIAEISNRKGAEVYEVGQTLHIKFWELGILSERPNKNFIHVREVYEMILPNYATLSDPQRSLLENASASLMRTLEELEELFD